MSSHTSTIMQLLRDWNNGDHQAMERLAPAIYPELHRLARKVLRSKSSALTLQTTELVHETYLRLIAQNRVQWQDTVHFYSVTTLLMRRILKDDARRKYADKRGRRAVELPLDANCEIAHEQAPELTALADALAGLEAFDAVKCRIVKLKFFGGLTLEETATALGMSTATAERHWRIARAWLHREISKNSNY